MPHWDHARLISVMGLLAVSMHFENRRTFPGKSPLVPVPVPATEEDGSGASTVKLYGARYVREEEFG